MTLPRRIRRLGRRLVRPVTRLTRLQVAALAVTLLAAAGGAVALVLALTPSSAPIADTGGGPPLRLPDHSSLPTINPAPGVPATVELVIPAGGIDIHVIEGDGVHVPLHLAMHYPGTSLPGAGGNSLFYAHAQPTMFLGLYRLHLGDEIRAVRADGSQVLYRVRGVQRVPFNDDAVLAPTPFEQVTLLTCTSYNPYNPRLIITATPE